MVYTRALPLLTQSCRANPPQQNLLHSPPLSEVALTAVLVATLAALALAALEATPAVTALSIATSAAPAVAASDHFLAFFFDGFESIFGVLGCFSSPNDRKKLVTLLKLKNNWSHF